MTTVTDPISLVKGQRVSLDKVAPGLVQALIGLGWDIRETSGQAFDLDAQLILLNAQDKMPTAKHHVFYNNLVSPDSSITHNGDNLTGEGDGDDETVIINFNNISPNIVKIIVVIDIYKAVERGQNFGQVNNAFVRMVNTENNNEILRYDLTEDYSTETCVSICEIYKKDGEWKVSADGAGTTLMDLLAKYR